MQWREEVWRYPWPPPWNSFSGCLHCSTHSCVLIVLLIGCPVQPPCPLHTKDATAYIDTRFSRDSNDQNVCQYMRLSLHACSLLQASPSNNSKLCIVKLTAMSRQLGKVRINKNIEELFTALSQPFSSIHFAFNLHSCLYFPFAD